MSLSCWREELSVLKSRKDTAWANEANEAVEIAGTTGLRIIVPRIPVSNKVRYSSNLYNATTLNSGTSGEWRIERIKRIHCHADDAAHKPVLRRLLPK